MAPVPNQFANETTPVELVKLDENFAAFQSASGSSLVGFNNGGSGATTRTAQVKMGDIVSVKDFGAVGDGIADDTTAIQAACVNPADVFFPAGVYLVNNLDIPSNTSLYREKNNQSVIKRKNNGTGNVFISVSNRSNVKFSNLTIDGNKANQTNAAHNISFVGCEQVTVEHCLIKNAKAVSGGFGAGIAFSDGTNDTELKQSRIAFNTIETCDGAGIYINKDSFISITDNLLKANEDGVLAINFVFPPVQYVQNYFTVTNNRCVNNEGVGIRFVGFYIGGTSSAPIQGPLAPPQKGVLISNNICKSNGQYGIAFQGFGATIAGNFVEENGTVSADGGILVNAWGSTITGNVVHNNAAYGIDGGGSVRCLFNSNVISYQGLTSGLMATGLNIGGTVDCQAVGNILENNGGTGSAAIYLSGWEFGGGSYFDQLGARVLVANNQIKLATSGAIGIYFNHGMDFATLTGNQVVDAAAGNAFLLRGGFNNFQVSANNNIDWSNGGFDFSQRKSTIK